MKTLLTAAIAMAAGTFLEWVICAVAVNRRKSRRKLARSKKTAQTDGEPRKLGTMDKILVLEAVVLILYSIADMIIFWHIGAEPTTLTACVFGVCGLENGVMGWIKTNKDKTNGPSGTTQDGGEPSSKREEPSDVGL